MGDDPGLMSGGSVAGLTGVNAAPCVDLPVNANSPSLVETNRTPLPAAMVGRGHCGCFAVKASNGRPLLFIYYRDPAGRRSLAKLLTRNAARRIALGVAKLPELLKRA